MSGKRKNNQENFPVKKSSSLLSPKNIPQKLSANIELSDNESPRKRGRKRRSSDSEIEISPVVEQKRHKTDTNKSENSPEKRKSKKFFMKADNLAMDSTESEVNIPPSTKHNLEEAVVAVVEAAAQAQKQGRSSKNENSNQVKPSGKRGRPKTKVDDTSKVSSEMKISPSKVNSPDKRGRPKTQIIDTLRIPSEMKISPSKVNTPGKRGRPKTKVDDTLKASNEVKVSPGKRGRPKSGVQAHSNTQLTIISGVELVVAHGKRGRPLSPLKTKQDPDNVKEHSQSGHTFLKVAGGKRGRPAINDKGAGSSPGKRGRPQKAIKVAKFTGKRGRPRNENIKAINIVAKPLSKLGRPRGENYQPPEIKPAKSPRKRGRPLKVLRGFGDKRGRLPNVKKKSESQTNDRISLEPVEDLKIIE